MLLSNVTMSYDRNEDNVYSVMIQNEAYFVSGVTVSVFVHAVNGTRYGPLSVAMDNASGSEYIAATYLYAYSLSLSSSCSPFSRLLSVATPLTSLLSPFSPSQYLSLFFSN